MPGRLLALVALLLAPCLLAPAATAHKAQDLMQQQDWSSTPPKATSPLKDWIAWVQHKHGGHYFRLGQPFAPPNPPGLPTDMLEITIDVRSGTRVTTSAGVTCTERWFKVWVRIVFDDGSIFVWMEEGEHETCDDGSETHWVETISTAGYEDIFTGAFTGWVRSYRGDALQIERKLRGRAPAGGTLGLTSLPAASLPWVGAEFDSVDIAVGPGGVLDLTGNPKANGPLFASSGPVVVRCDTVLMDPGVVLPDLCAAPPQVLPGGEVHELLLTGPSMAHLDAAGPASLELRVHNLGNAGELVTLDWIDVLGWSFGGPTVVPLAPGQHGVVVQVPFQVPPSAQPGDASPLLAQASSAQAPAATRDVLLERVPQAATPTTYCAAKPNSLGCLPQIGWSGAPSATGYDDFHVLTTQAISNLNGILFYGPGAASVPFQGGTLCVQGPVTRTPAQSSQGNPGNGDCSGIYSFHFSHDYLAAKGLVPGTSVWCQYWTRDPASAPFGSGLSDALAFQVAP